jgi:tRNA/tmRNA/rRNA uracil-C5-methylase (TrmA/RlmC/RlmD family)
VKELPLLQIDDIAFGGKGVARHQGKVIFIPFVGPDETVTARLIKEKKSFAEGRVLKIVTPSPDRVPAPCPYFTVCGGCIYQHLRYDRQLEIKAAQVEQTLRRVGKINEPPMRPIIASPNPYGYRNRIRVHRAANATGFFGYESRELVDIEQCLLAKPEVNRALHKLRASKAPEGSYALRASGGAGPFFEQINEAVTLALAALIDQALERNQALLVDAYCGGGRFARALKAHAAEIIGIEASEAAVQYARNHAGTTEQYIHGDVADHLGDVLSRHDPARTSVIVDPPPDGLSPRVIDFLLGAPPREIAYVSCNPATLARDLALLTKSYQLRSVTPLDMFPQTAEIEVFAHLTTPSS